MPQATPGIPVPRPNRVESGGMTFIYSVVHRWASRPRDHLRAAFLYCGTPTGRFYHCCPKTTNPAVIRRFCFAAVPHQDFWTVDVVGFLSVSVWLRPAGQVAPPIPRERYERSA